MCRFLCSLKKDYYEKPSLNISINSGIQEGMKLLRPSPVELTVKASGQNPTAFDCCRELAV